MEQYLDERFFKAVRKDIRAYATDFDAAIARSRALEEQELEQMAKQGEYPEIFEQM